MTLDKVKLKTINNQSVIGDGNISVGGSSVDIVTSWSSTTSDSKVPSEKLTKNSLDGKANSSHTHTKSQITDFPTIPSKTSDLTNDGADGTNVFVANNDSRLSDARTPTSHTHTSNQVTDLIDTIYPVGSIYMSVSNTSPSILFGGTWEKIEDAFLLASGTNYAAGTTGGEATHTLTTNEMPSHRHESSRRDVYVASGSATGLVGYSTSFSQTGVTSYTGGGQAHNNMPPYLAVNVWKRTQ